MNILFLTMARIKTLEGQGIYLDLLSELVKKGHRVEIAAPAERYLKEKTNRKEYDGYGVLRVRVGNLQKTNIIEKGISTVLLEPQFLSAVKKYYKNIKFDLVLYSTPPINFGRVINYIKKRDNAKSYLLLKDIFPQNAVDLNMFSEKGLIYRYFRGKEKQLYRQSDYIGCMSEANAEYLTEHNAEIDKTRVYIAPNSIKIRKMEAVETDKSEIRKKYGIPLESTVFVYGGNLGKPQGIPFLIECLKKNENRKDRFFVICGTGTEYGKLKNYIDGAKPDNIMLINGLPAKEYEEFIKACDVGLVFLDYRFTIPNFPSRILSYMQNAMPVLACTDVNTDMGKIIEEGGFGWWCPSNDSERFTRLAEYICGEDLKKKGENARKYLEEYYSAEKCCEQIINCVRQREEICV